MIKIILAIAMLTSILSASNSKKDKILQKSVEEQMKKEQKYAKEQTFYNEDNYDFKGAEVNPESVKMLKPLEVNDLDMDDVYD
jgi:sortase (surface protein transpeptidase)